MERGYTQMGDEAYHAGHRTRLRERFAREGLEGFAPHEALELLLTYAIPRIDVNPLAHRLLSHFGSLAAVLEADMGELQQVEGMGPQSATLIAALLPLFRMYRQSQLLPRKKIGTYSQLADYCRALFIGENHEKIYVLCFNAQLELLAASLIDEGTPTEVSYLPRKILQELIRRNAAGAVLTHNHPSGSPRPSEEDLAVTRQIQALLNGVGIHLYDHVIVAGQQDYSLFSHRLIPHGEPAFTAVAADRPQRTMPVRNKE